jgi:hypothetical protein
MKTEEDEAFDEIARKQGMWGGGYQAKRQMAADKLQEPAQEPVAWEQFYPDIGKPQIAFNAEVVGYVAPQRPWVGLTDADIERIKLMTYEKETNADGEEQEAVNIDWLIKTTEHFCKEKNNGT